MCFADQNEGWRRTCEGISRLFFACLETFVLRVFHTLQVFFKFEGLEVAII